MTGHLTPERHGMAGQPKRDEPWHEVEATDEAQQEETVRRIALRFLTTPP